MPLREIPNAAGDPRWVRARYRPANYTVPPHELRRLRGSATGRGSEDLLAEPGGPFEGMREYPARADCVRTTHVYRASTGSSRTG